MNSLRYLGKDWSSGSMLTSLKSLYRSFRHVVLCTVAIIAVAFTSCSIIVLFIWIVVCILLQRVGLIAPKLSDLNTSEPVVDNTQPATQSVKLSENEVSIMQLQNHDHVSSHEQEQQESSSVSSHITYRSSNSNPTDQIEPNASIFSIVQPTDDTHMSVKTYRPASTSVNSTASSDVGSVHTALEEQVVQNTSAMRIEKDESDSAATFAYKQTPVSISKQPTHSLTTGFSHDPMSSIIDDPVLADFYRKKQMKIEAEELAKRKVLQPQQVRAVPNVIYKQTRTPAASVKSEAPSVQDNKLRKSAGIVETMIDGKIWHMRPDRVKDNTPMPASTFLEVSPKIAPHRRKILPIKKPVIQSDFIGKLSEEHENMMSGKQPEKSEFVWQTDLEVLHNIERASKIKSWNESMAEVRKQFKQVDSGSSPQKHEQPAQNEATKPKQPPKSIWASQDKVPEVSSSSKFQLSANAQVFTPSATQHRTATASALTLTRTDDITNTSNQSNLDEHNSSVFSIPPTLVPINSHNPMRDHKEQEDYDSPSSIWAGLDRF